MLTRQLRVREVFPQDWSAVDTIMRANGVNDYEWPYGAWGAIAILDEQTIAFCAGRDIPKGMLIEDLWALPGHDGIRGLAILAAWVEEQAQRLATQMNRPMSVGGFIFDTTPAHEAALRKRGYVDHCRVLRKTFLP